VASSEATSPQAQPAINLAKDDLTKRTKLGVDAIGVTSVASATWPDSSLGCPQPGFMYSQMVTPGYRIVLSAQGKAYEYHSDRGTRVVLCQPGNSA
jgi:hypothetical protein